MEVFEIKHDKLCTWLWSGCKKQTRLEILMTKIEQEGSFNEQQLSLIKNKLQNCFIPQFSRYWNTCNRMPQRFKDKYVHFMDKMFKVDIVSSIPLKSPNRHNSRLKTKVQSETLHASSSKRGRGRPKLPFDHISKRSKRRRVAELRRNFEHTELQKAASTQKCEDASAKGTSAITDELQLRNGALALYMDLGLTKSKYESLRSYNKMILGNKYYPSYEQIKLAKSDCYPANIEVCERGASVNLQSLLDHTVRRIIMSMQNEELHDTDGKEFTLYGKWGMDGTSGQQTFKQKWNVKTKTGNKLSSSEQAALSETDVPMEQENPPECLSDATVFIISFVPLQIVSDVDNHVLWTNNRPSSVRYCSPIKFEFAKETIEQTLKEYRLYSEEIQKLVPTLITKDATSFTVKYQMHCTMIDGKVCNVLTNQKSTKSCNICGANPTDMNNFEKVKSRKENEESCQFGLSTLHCWIRFMECILHLAYNIEFKKNNASKENKIIKAQRKEKIQQALKAELAISVDIVKQSYGTTNDGNTARRFFSEPDTVARILGIDVDLIKRFGNILQVMASGHEIDLDKFEEYATETAKTYIEQYNWYYMPPSVHKVLIYGRKIMEELCIPIGRLSEEAQEANNKIFKYARLHNSRLCSRTVNNIDVMHHLLISSDPVISKMRLEKDKKFQELTPEAKNLLR